MKLKAPFYNYRTDSYDYLTAAPEDWGDYIPQDDPAQGLYRTYLAMGHTPIDAAEKVLYLWLETAAAAQRGGEGE